MQILGTIMSRSLSNKLYSVTQNTQKSWLCLYRLYFHRFHFNFSLCLVGQTLLGTWKNIYLSTFRRFDSIVLKHFVLYVSSINEVVYLDTGCLLHRKEMAVIPECFKRVKQPICKIKYNRILCSQKSTRQDFCLIWHVLKKKAINLYPMQSI